MDFYLPDYNVAIECQGIQHFEPVETFGGYEAFEKIIERDRIKKKHCVKVTVLNCYILWNINLRKIVMIFRQQKN